MVDSSVDGAAGKAVRPAGEAERAGPRPGARPSEDARCTVHSADPSAAHRPPTFLGSAGSAAAPFVAATTDRHGPRLTPPEC